MSDAMTYDALNNEEDEDEEFDLEDILGGEKIEDLGPDDIEETQIDMGWPEELDPFEEDTYEDNDPDCGPFEPDGPEGSEIVEEDEETET